MIARARVAYRKRHPTREVDLYRARLARDPDFAAGEKKRLNKSHRTGTKNNIHKKFAWNAEARGRKRNATPPWLTEEMREQMREIYLDAATRPGGPWHVDHIVPLAGQEACGLHVPWNLRIIPKLENLKKGAKLHSTT